MVAGVLKPLRWVGSSKKDLDELPTELKHEFGYALHVAQEGDQHENVKPLKGFGGAGVLEVVESSNGNAYRAVYTVKFTTAVYVLHVFQKKSKRGARTPKVEVNLIRLRLKAAQEWHERGVTNKEGEA